jgi:4'-phosphopantetheinyl transferase
MGSAFASDVSSDDLLALLARPTASAGTDDATEVIATRLSLGPDVVRASAALLSTAERHRASRFAFDRDRHRFIVARARLRQLLAARLGVRPESVEIVYGPRGKPTLGARFAASRVRFNVSHCDDVTVFGFTCGGAIGIDVEAVRPVREADAIAAQFFSRREHAAYRALDPRERSLGVFQCWTRKEAFIKALGDGCSHPLDRFDVSFGPGEPASLLRLEGTPRASDRWRMDSFSPAPGCVAAVVVERRRPPRAGRLAAPQDV